MATINKVTEQKMNGVCNVAVSYIFDGNRKKRGPCFFFVCVFVVAKSSNLKAILGLRMHALYTYPSR